jgi:N-acetylneuraminic acid mutarotase
MLSTRFPINEYRWIWYMTLVFCQLHLSAVGCLAQVPQAAECTPLPDTEGYAGAFAGVTGGGLLVAGGANFPDAKPWEGGQKRWYDKVYWLDHPQGTWREIGRLPEPLGYGVCCTYDDWVICAGGSNVSTHSAAVYRLRWHQKQLQIERLADLPTPLANAAGALVGKHLYVVGGQSTATAEATQDVWRLDLSLASAAWESQPTFPGASRILSIAAPQADQLWICGGVHLTRQPDQKLNREYLADVYCFDPIRGWQRREDLPHPLAAAPSPAPATEAGFWILGGDDGTQIKTDPAAHRGFPSQIWFLEQVSGTWQQAGELRESRVTAAAVYWQRRWVVPSGEIRPGVRSPRVTAWQWEQNQ